MERSPVELARHGGDRIAEALQAHGVQRIFTLCGGHISPILAASKARGIRIVDVRDEVTAVFAADATARLSGQPGVAAVTAGPGITNTITALKNAQLAQSPVILLGGAAPTALQGRGALQDIDQRPLVAPHVKRFLKMRRVRELGPAVAEAFELAMSDVPGPVFIECPVDLLYPEAEIRKWYAEAAGKGTALPDRALRWYLSRHAERMFAGAGDRSAAPAPRGVVVPRASDSALHRAAAMLERAKQPLFVIGSQAVVQADEADQLAEAVGRLNVPVYLSGLARGLLGRDHPLQMRHARRNALREADCVLLAGVPCDFRLDYGRHVRRSATLIAANRSAKDARLNRRPDVAAIGDAGQFIRALAQTLPTTAGRWSEWVAALRARDLQREAEIDRQAAATGEYVNPLAFFRALDAEAGDDAVFVADGGDFVGTASYIVRPTGPLAWLDPGAFGTLGVGAGFALGAKLVHPDAEVWILYGDGSAGYSLSEFDTFVRHGVAVIAVVGNDAAWMQIAREQVELLGDDVATVLAHTNYQCVVEGFGAVGIQMDAPEQIPQALAQAKAAAAGGKPVLINAILGRTDFRKGSISM